MPPLKVWPLGLWRAPCLSHTAVINGYNEQTIVGALLPDAPQGVAVQTCSSCNKRRRFWDIFLGGWNRCQNCATDYCGDCFDKLTPTPAKPDEPHSGSRYCGKCKAVISPAIPIDMSGWP